MPTHTLPWYSPIRLLRSAYVRRLRPLLADADPIQLAGISGPRNRKPGDRLFARLLQPGFAVDEPRYEQALVAGLNAHVRVGDSIVVVGGGMGITAAVAAMLTGPTGGVICYEGNVSGLADIDITARRNGVSDVIEARCAIVGEAVGVYGDSHSGAVVRADELPDCDVLELDCEGSEIGIIQHMTIRPRAIIVETHGMLGTPSASVRAALEAKDYSVTDLGYAEPRFLDRCVRDDIRVLAATRLD